MHLSPNYWDELPESKPLLGAIALAKRCLEVERYDFEVAIVTRMLARKNPQDFPLGKLTNLAWLLNNYSTQDAYLIPTFLDSICEPKWLGWQYYQSPRDSIASGLIELAMHQPVHIRRRFYNIAFGIRLSNDLSQFDLVSHQEQTEIIQLLGAVTLFGWVTKKEYFSKVSVDIVCKLPIIVLAHDERAKKVEDLQYQLWLGLYAYTSIVGRTLSIPESVINKTLDLWNVNLSESSVSPKSVKHRVNQEMVAWLEKSLKNGVGLMPSGRTKPFDFI